MVNLRSLPPPRCQPVCCMRHAKLWLGGRYLGETQTVQIHLGKGLWVPLDTTTEQISVKVSPGFHLWGGDATGTWGFCRGWGPSEGAVIRTAPGGPPPRRPPPRALPRCPPPPRGPRTPRRDQGVACRAPHMSGSEAGKPRAGWMEGLFFFYLKKSTRKNIKK